MSTKPRISPTRRLLGLRGQRNRPAQEILDAATVAVEELSSREPSSYTALSDVKREFVNSSRAYYSLAACSRRSGIDAQSLVKALDALYRFRAKLEQAIVDAFPVVQQQDTIMSAALTKSFFGVSAKQGISIRYPLLTCIPTRLCGGRCYAHDGRDRELHLIFRACLNFYVGKMWEMGESRQRASIERMLDPIIEYGIRESVKDAQYARAGGFSRSPRIRFSHIGEMIATPEFTNWLAYKIKRLDSSVQCVVYTRHLWADKYDPKFFTVNFTVDGKGGDRLAYKPSWARLVSSAWDGQVNPGADINFLEHHVEKHSAADGHGYICPVTAAHSSTPTCDLAKCDKCFRNGQEN